MKQLRKLEAKLNRLYGQRSGAFVVGDYSLVMAFSQEIEATKKRIAKIKQKGHTHD